MFKSLLNAKKNKRMVLAVVAVFLVMSAINAESFGLTIDFFGMAQYANTGGLVFENGFVPVLPVQNSNGFVYFGMTTTGSDGLAGAINEGAPYYGIAAVAYDLDYSVPEWDQPYNWSVNVMAKAEGSYTYIPTTGGDDVTAPITVPISEELVENFDLGEGSLQDFLGDKADLLDQIASIPLTDYDPTLGGYLIDGDEESGVVYVALEDPDFFDGLIPDGTLVGGDVIFGGRIILTAEPIESSTVPEPASMFLLGSGLVGLLGARRKILV